MSRARLLATGFSLKGITVLPVPLNPSRVYHKNGVEIPTTRLSVSNIYLSVSDKDVTEAIKKAGYVPLSPLSLVCARDSSGQLTSFRNGTRSFVIELPSVPLPKTAEVQGKFTAFSSAIVN